MSKKGFSIDNKALEYLMEDFDEAYGTEALTEAVKDAFNETRKYINIEIGKALQNSEYNFEKNKGYSQGRTRESLIEVSRMEAEVDGTIITAYAGVNLKDAPEALILAVEGAPNRAADLKLRNAIKVKGKIKKEVDRIQERVFISKLRGGAGNG